MHKNSGLQIWLKPLAGNKRFEQSQTVRLLLKQVCEVSGVKLPKDYLASSGLSLIKNIERQNSISISLSHCAGMAAVALGKGRLGLDCEQSGKRRRWGTIAQQFFPPIEATIVTSVPESEQESKFLRSWVLKEAYIKAIHGTLFGDINKLTLSTPEAIRISGECVEPTEVWRVWHIRYGTYHLGVCNEQNLRPELHFFETDDCEITGYRDVTEMMIATEMLHSQKQ
jgi:phosphopantetheinyl transferase